MQESSRVNRKIQPGALLVVFCKMCQTLPTQYRIVSVSFVTTANLHAPMWWGVVLLHRVAFRYKTSVEILKWMGFILVMCFGVISEGKTGIYFLPLPLSVFFPHLWSRWTTLFIECLTLTSSHFLVQVWPPSKLLSEHQTSNQINLRIIST